MIGQRLVSVAKNFARLAVPDRLDVPVVHPVDKLADAIPAPGGASEIVALNRLLAERSGSRAAVPGL